MDQKFRREVFHVRLVPGTTEVVDWLKLNPNASQSPRIQSPNKNPNLTSKKTEKGSKSPPKSSNFSKKTAFPIYQNQQEKNQPQRKNSCQNHSNPKSKEGSSKLANSDQTTFSVDKNLLEKNSPHIKNPNCQNQNNANPHWQNPNSAKSQEGSSALLISSRTISPIPEKHQGKIDPQNSNPPRKNPSCENQKNVNSLGGFANLVISGKTIFPIVENHQEKEYPPKNDPPRQKPRSRCEIQKTTNSQYGFSNSVISNKTIFPNGENHQRKEDTQKTHSLRENPNSGCQNQKNANSQEGLTNLAISNKTIFPIDVKQQKKEATQSISPEKKSNKEEKNGRNHEDFVMQELEKAFQELQETIKELCPPCSTSEEEVDTQHKSVGRKEALPRRVIEKVQDIVKKAMHANPASKSVPEWLIIRLSCILSHMRCPKSIKRLVKKAEEVELSSHENVKQKLGNNYLSQEGKVEINYVSQEDKMECMKKELERRIEAKLKILLQSQAGHKRKRWPWGKDVEDMICVIYDELDDSQKFDKNFLKNFLCGLAKLWPEGSMDVGSLKRAIERSKSRKLDDSTAQPIV